MSVGVVQKIISTGRASAKEIGNSVSDDRLIRLGFVSDPTKPHLIEKGRDRFIEALASNRALKEREATALINEYGNVFSPDEVMDIAERDINSLVGSALIPIKGDRSDLGISTQIGGIPLATPAEVQAGRKFPAQQFGLLGIPDDELPAWASNLGIAQKVANKAKGVKDITEGMPVKGIYTAQGYRSMDFSTAPAEAFALMLPNIPLSKASKQAFDKTIRSKYPDFVGVDSPDLVAQIRGDIPITDANGNVVKSTGDFRKFILNRAELEPYRNAGFPQYDEIAQGLEDPVVAGVDSGSVGSLILDLDTSGNVLPNNFHYSYDTSILRDKGSVPTRLRYQTPFETIFQDSMEQLKRDLTNPSEKARAKGAVPRPLTYQERMNAVADRGAESPNSFEIYTEQKADAYLRYLQRGLKAGLPLTVLAAGAAQAGVDDDTIQLGNRMATQGMSAGEQAMANMPMAGSGDVGSITAMPEGLLNRGLSATAQGVRFLNEAADQTPLGLLNPIGPSVPQALENAAYGSSDTIPEIRDDVLRVIGLL